ncbi:hypothetical protein K0M31_018564 [Melipona bicolor]|uniref:Uncharacterized protein n=1 Tax=Melipona bicolor TaxID=60889 RepID=A0AA40KRT7_9HYME|nr:hypothetical protein K0M31_018564 [Melipona bicolor]
MMAMMDACSTSVFIHLELQAIRCETGERTSPREIQRGRRETSGGTSRKKVDGNVEVRLSSLPLQIATGTEAAIMDTFPFAREPPSSNEISRIRVMKHEQGLRKIFRGNGQRA